MAFRRVVRNSITAPGISVSAVINSMSLSKLNSLLGDELVDTLSRLSGSVSTTDELRKIATSLYADNPASVKSTEVRHRLIDALSCEKAEELCKTLDIAPKRDAYTTLKQIELGDKRERERDEAMLNFFGIVEDPVAPSIQDPARTVAEPSYGLFEYQRGVVSRTLHALNEQPRKVLLHMPTGSGKTRTAMHVIARHLLERGPTLVCWLANSAELLEQAAEEIEQSWSTLGDRSINVYRFWGDRNIDLGSIRDGVLVAGFAKIYAAYRREQNSLIALGDRASLTVVDEAHQAVAPTYRSVIEGLYTKQPRNALLGLTATPGRSWDDIEADEELSEFFGHDKVTLAIKDYPDPVTFLIAEGYLARPSFRTLEFDEPILQDHEAADVEKYGELSGTATKSLSENSHRNYKILTSIEELLSRHDRVIVFGASVYHANLLAGILAARGHDSKIVTAETPIARRQRIIKQFRSDSVHPIILCNYGVLTTGFDAPKTSAALIARPTQSLVLYSQMVGRAIRGPKAGGNEEAEIVTVVDTALPGFGSVAEAFGNWEEMWNEHE